MASFREKNGKTFLFIFFVVIFSCGIIFLIFLFHCPAVGRVLEKEADISLEEILIEKKVKVFHGTYFSLSLPESFEEKRHTVSDDSFEGNILEQVFFSEGNVDGRKIAVVVERRPTGGIREISAVAFRTLHPDTYAREEMLVGEWHTSLFTKGDAVYEVTGFFEKGDYIVSVSVTSAVMRPEKIKEFFFETVKNFEFSGKVTSME